MLRALLPLFILCISYIGFSQSRFTLNGYVRDSITGESISGVSIKVNGGSSATISNAYGFYSITLPAGQYEFYISHVSYIASTHSLLLNQESSVNFSLSPRSAGMQEVVVFSKRRDQNVRSSQSGRMDLSIQQIKKVPAIFGEVDILKTFQLMPGVRNAGEGNTGFYVRGGGPDQNLILLDDAIVYNPGHLFGFFSVFNGDAIRNATLIKGGMPAQYGGRLSSVLDISMKEGNLYKNQFEGGIGLIASRFSAEGPIEKGISSFMLSGRRTYIDALLKPFVSKESSFYGSGYYFYDLNAKFNHRFSKKDRLFVSSYFGRDVFNFSNSKRSFSTSVPWGNATGSIRWNHVFGPRIFSNTTIVVNDYRFQFNATQERFNISLRSGIRDVGIKSDFDFYPNAKHRIKTGVLVTHHRFLPNVFSGSQDSVQFKPNGQNEKYALEKAIYFQDDWQATEKLQFNLGIRWSQFTQLGPFTKYTTDVNGNRIDSIRYQKNRKVISYQGFEPRLSARYLFSDQFSFKSSISRNIQYIHLVSNAGSTLPTDLWVPSTYLVKPQISWLATMGLFRNFADNQYETSIELYYKDMQQQIEYREGYTPSLSDPETEFVFGRGWSYGAEFFINKVRGLTSGWLGYTLSWTWRKFPEINQGLQYPARFDRRHDLSLVLNRSLSKKWQLGTVIVYGTGNALTLPERFYVMNGVLTQEFSRINQYRMRSYHRLDLSLTYQPAEKAGKKLKSQWVFSIYNLYSRLNPYFIYYDQEGSLQSSNLRISAKQVSLFPIIPSVTWNYKL